MTSRRDWGGLGAILTEAEQIAADVRSRPDVDCPVCGNRLDVNARGVRNCDVGHYRSDGTAEAR